MIAGALVILTSVIVPVSATRVLAATGYEALAAPQRLLDTRPGEPTADGGFAGQGASTANSTLTLTVGGRVGLPPLPAAVMLNITVVNPSGAGYVTVFPCDQPQPTASNLNYDANQTVPNAVISTVSAAGTVCLYTLQRTHLIVDIAGWFPTGAFNPLPNPQRLLDTRPGEVTADGQFVGGGIRPGGSELVLQVAGRAGVQSGAGAAALNVTATGTTGPGYVTVYPCDAGRPDASNLNYFAGQTVPNLVMTRISTAGTICLYVHTAAHLVVDVSGTIPPDAFVPLAAPRRLLDTRTTGTTADDRFRASGAQPGGGTLQLDVAGRVGIPADASAVVLNVTAVNPSALGYVSVHPRGSDLPTASNVNYAPGAVVANSVIARVGNDGDICVFTSGGTDLVVDVAGWLTGTAPAAGATHCPSLSSGEPNGRGQLIARAGVHTAIGVDRIAVLACDAPPAPGDPGVRTLDPVAVAAWANAEVAPYFTEASNGRYQQVFEAHPLGRITRSSAAGCRSAGRDITDATFTNVLVYDSTYYGGGLAGPGTIGSRDVTVLERSPRQSNRGAWVGGGAPLIDPSVIIHELGHTLHWPHSYISSANEYDNPIDIMSGIPPGELVFSPDLCPSAQPGRLVWCKPQNTLAYNRLANAWIDDTQIQIHRSGLVNYTLDRPSGAGTQLVALPDPNAPLAAMVIEARPAIGRDSVLRRGGVSVHLVDQGAGNFDGISLGRRQKQAMGAENSYDHVLAPGATVSIYGVTISVLATSGDGYVVTVSGSYRRPGSLMVDRLGEPESCATRLDVIDDDAGSDDRCWK